MSDGFAFVQDIDHRPHVIDLEYIGEPYPVWTAKHSGVPLVFGSGVAVYQRVSEDGAGKVYGVEVESGKVLWTSDAIEPDLNALIVGEQLLVERENWTEVYDLRTGKAQWEFRGKLLGWNWSRFVFADDVSSLEVSVVNRDGK